MDNRISLPKGYDLGIESQDSFFTVHINDEIGRGGNCIVYKGERSILINEKAIRNSVIVKEFYPAGMEITRSEDSGLQITDQHMFDLLKDHFAKGQSNHAEFYEYYREQVLPGLFLYGCANNTVYAVSSLGKGRTLSQINFETLSLNRIASIMGAVCSAIGKIHTKEFLYLDCKPDNFFYYENTNELQAKIYLFDFDTITSLKDIRSGRNSFCSASFGWIPPEQELISLASTGLRQYRDPQMIGYHTDIYSIGAIFFWLLTYRKPSDSDLAQIQEGSFDWEMESRFCSGSETEVIYTIQDILKNTLDPDAERRKEKFRHYIDIRKLQNRFQKLYGLTLGDNVHFEPIHHELEVIKKLIANAGTLENSESERPLLPTSKNRFKYNSNSTLFRGRNAEIKALLNMCAEKEYFLWMGICGEGGTGKSRLAYELCVKMNERNWDVFAPLHYSANKDILRETIRHLKRDVLICLDYVKQDIDEIEGFIRSIVENPYHKEHKVRLLLIEREKQAVLLDDPDIEQYKYRTEVAPYCFEGLIELSPMEDEEICSIVGDYIEGQGSAKISSSDAIELIVETLKSVDSEGRRPLYALFIADAWLDDEELRKWDRKDALEYLLKKERQRLSRIIADSKISLNTIEKGKYFSAVEYLYAAATYRGKIRMEEYADLIDSKWGLSGKDELLMAILSEYGILSLENEIVGWEPDLMGEYFCIDYLNRLKWEDARDFIHGIIDNDLSAFTGYSEMIYKDYPDLIDDSKWIDLLRDICFPSKYRYVRKKQFAGNTFLRNIRFDGRVTLIQAGAFRDCINLEKIVFPSSLEVIESSAFQGCIGMTDVTMEDGKGKDPSIIAIENNAFKNCSALENIILPESLQTMGISVFENCSALKKIEIPHKIERIDSFSFAGCKALRSVVFRTPGKISLGDSCFFDCNCLTEVKGSRRISAIENGVFRDCVSLESISLSHRLTVFRENVFSGCRSLKNIDLSQCNLKSLPVRAFFECTSLSSVILAEGIKEIGDKAFYACVNLEKLYIPGQLNKIGARAFFGCKRLIDLKLEAPVQGIGISAFSGCTSLSLSDVRGLLTRETKELCGFEFS